MPPIWLKTSMSRKLKHKHTPQPNFAKPNRFTIGNLVADATQNEKPLQQNTYSMYTCPPGFISYKKNLTKQPIIVQFNYAVAHAPNLVGIIHRSRKLKHRHTPQPNFAKPNRFTIGNLVANVTQNEKPLLRMPPIWLKISIGVGNWNIKIPPQPNFTQPNRCTIGNLVAVVGNDFTTKKALIRSSGRISSPPMAGVTPNTE